MGSLIKGDISAGHARALINLDTEELQLKILEEIIKNNLSVRKVEGLVKKQGDSGKTGKKSAGQKASLSLDSIYQSDLENQLRGIFGTKVLCRQKKDGAGEIVIEFYSNDELDRLLELFDVINKPYN